MFFSQTLTIIKTLHQSLHQEVSTPISDLYPCRRHSCIAVDRCRETECDLIRRRWEPTFWLLLATWLVTVSVALGWVGGLGGVSNRWGRGRPDWGCWWTYSSFIRLRRIVFFFLRFWGSRVLSTYKNISFSNLTKRANIIPRVSYRLWSG